jgi:hypothetical protein
LPEESFRLDTFDDNLQSHVVEIALKFASVHSLVVVINPVDNDDGNIIVHTGLERMYGHLAVMLPIKELGHCT